MDASCLKVEQNSFITPLQGPAFKQTIPPLPPFHSATVQVPSKFFLAHAARSAIHTAGRWIRIRITE